MNRNKIIEIKTRRIGEIDLHWKGFYRFSGISLVIVAVLWSVVFQTGRILYSAGFPTDPETYLKLVSQHQILAALTWSLWIVSDLLLMAPTVALYIALKPYNRTLALLGSLFAMFFNIYDICVTELNSLTLVSLSHVYAQATTDILKTPIIGAATYGYFALPLQTVLSFAIGTTGYLLWCIPMFKSEFRLGTAILGFLMSVIALAGSAAPLFPTLIPMGLCQMIAVPLCAFWFILLGVHLCRYGKRSQEIAA